MSTLRTGVLAAAAAAVGLLTLRRFRGGGAEDEAPAPDPSHETAETPAEHAAAAVEHARLAAKGAMDSDAVEIDLGEDADGDASAGHEDRRGRVRSATRRVLAR